MKKPSVFNKTSFFIVLLIISFSFLTYCGNSEDKQKAEANQKIVDSLRSAQKMQKEHDQQKNEQLEQDEIKKKELEAKAVSLIGTYVGTFDKRTTTLEITEQTGNTFKGKIQIDYREVIYQQVSGQFNPKDKIITMKDFLHSRYAGSYTGKLSDDLKTFSGVFTMTIDKTTFDFSLTKK